MYSGVNANFVGPGTSVPWHCLHEVKNLARTFLFADCGASYVETPVVLDYTAGGQVGGGWNTKALHGREGLNFIFVDGHGEFLA